MFVDEGGSADRFAAGGEALAQSGEDEQDGREPADLVEAGQDADESGADADEEIVTVSVLRLPTLSPRAPKNSPPRGRMTKATPKVAKMTSRPVTLSPSGKKYSERMTAERP